MNSKILILCTGNSCRSQMAEGILKSFDKDLQVFSAGTHPEIEVNPNAIEVMQEIGIDISNNSPKNVDIFTKNSFDYVITVCGNAKEYCPIFIGNVHHRLHIGFDDPAKAKGHKNEILEVYRTTRNEISEKFKEFYKSLK
ncbi:MAG: arsenate reductase ArsC [Bacteroidetes bacterium]|nr:arsenate reductase ArsC [Bacteroidota bacterium]